jgi:carboxymethylenebutenolidase
MAAHLAASGYAVLAVNHYRGAKAPVLDPCRLAHAGRTGQAQAPDHSDHTRRHHAMPPPIGWLDRQGEVDTMHRIGTCGFCMGGPYTVRTAAAEPDRIGAAASFHGAGLVDTGPDSPHLLLPRTKAAFLFAIAQNDDARSPDDKTTLKTAAAPTAPPRSRSTPPSTAGAPSTPPSTTANKPRKPGPACSSCSRRTSPPMVSLLFGPATPVQCDC